MWWILGRVLGGWAELVRDESLRRLQVISNPVPSWRTEMFYSDDNTIEQSEEIVPNETQSSDVIEYGLVLPNGLVLWNQYHNWSLATPQDREQMVEILRKTADECGFTQEKFLSNYNWVARRVQSTVTALGAFPITDPTVTATDSEDDNGDNGDISAEVHQTGHGDRGDLRQGSVGSPA